MDTDYPTFATLNEKLVELFQAKQFAEALDFVTAEGPRFPDDRVDVDYWRMCAAARVGNLPLLIQIAEQALSEGMWYGEMLWRQSPSFAPLQGNPEFERIVSASRAAQEIDAPSGAPIMITRTPENHSAASPLLIALHGNTSSAERTLPYWEAAVAHGWVMALPQSTQIMHKGSLFAWNDLETAAKDVQARYAQLQNEIAFDRNRIVLAGHSMGGLVAIQMALTGALNVHGFIANGPAVPFLDEPEETLHAILESARVRGLRGYFIIGANDDAIFADKVQALAEKIKAAGIPCGLEIVPDATHDYSPAYDAALRRALDSMNAE